jgi:ketosteroid isomerase-like protein
MLDDLHPDGVADWSRSRGPFRGVYRGRQEVLAFFAEVDEAWDEVEYFHTELIPIGERVVRVGGMRARGRGSGVEIEASGAQVFEFRDGMVWRVTLYQDRDEALAAVGLT